MSETRPPIGQPDIIRLSDEDASRKVLESAVCGLRELLNGLTQSRRTGGALGAADADMRERLQRSNTRVWPGRCAVCCLALAAACAAPATAEEPGRSVEDFAQQKRNPFADAISLSATLSFGLGSGPRQELQPSLTFQPLIPLPLSQNWRLVTRSNVPIINIPDPDGVTGLGDIDVSLFLTPERTGKWVWGAGPILQFPAATDEALGTGKWAAGPTAGLVYVDGPWLNGMLVSHLWSFAGSSTREDVSLTQIEVKFSYLFSGSWYIDTNPVMTYDWKVPSDQGWTIPIGLDIGKVFKIGNQGMSLQLGAYYNAKKPAGTAAWFLQTQFTLTY